MHEPTDLSAVHQYVERLADDKRQNHHRATISAAESIVVGAATGMAIDRGIRRRRSGGEFFAPATRALFVWVAFVCVGIGVTLLATEFGSSSQASWVGHWVFWPIVVMGFFAGRIYMKSWKRRKGHLPQPYQQPIGADIRDLVVGPPQSQPQPVGQWMQDPDGGWHFIR
jgi:hypothetical protein